MKETGTGVGWEFTVNYFFDIEQNLLQLCLTHDIVAMYFDFLLVGAEYYWRLDDDSNINENITFDIFKEMKTNDFRFGYINDRFDYRKGQVSPARFPDCNVKGLWTAATYFIVKNNLQPTFFQYWKESRNFYSHFEVSRAGVWRNELYRDFMDFLDSLKGIEIYGWSDADIKSIFVSITVKNEDIRWFGDIAYRHNYLGIIATETHVAERVRLTLPTSIVNEINISLNALEQNLVAMSLVRPPKSKKKEERISKLLD